MLGCYDNIKYLGDQTPRTEEEEKELTVFPCWRWLEQRRRFVLRKLAQYCSAKPDRYLNAS